MTLKGPTRQGSNASIDLGIFQKPQMFPIRSEHASDTLPSGIYETKQEAGAFPVNLTNPRLRWKRDLLKGTPLTSALFLLDCWALVGYPGTVQSAGSSWNCASLTFQWRPPTLRLSRELWPTEPYCLAAGGGASGGGVAPWQIRLDHLQSQDSDWILSSRKE